VSNWTHAICDDCWDEQRPESPSPQKGTGDPQACCYCGKPTCSGIFVRDDPATMTHPGPGIWPVHVEEAS
jgi:hypothetical protein